MEKKRYQQPELEIERFLFFDIITASSEGMEQEEIESPEDWDNL